MPSGTGLRGGTGLLFTFLFLFLCVGVSGFFLFSLRPSSIFFFFFLIFLVPKRVISLLFPPSSCTPPRSFELQSGALILVSFSRDAKDVWKTLLPKMLNLTLQFIAE